jgi:CheY-like chemotaxis protein
MSHFRILLIEDNSRDVELVQLALEESAIDHTLHVETDGEAALRHLKDYSPRPDLVLLDLNIPKYNGLEVLKEIRKNPRLRALPVIILTNSNSQEDVRKAYATGCNAYIRKPLGFDALQKTVEVIQLFWCNVATLPPRPDSIPPSDPRREE